jgi:hypothetical protein
MAAKKQGRRRFMIAVPNHDNFHSRLREAAEALDEPMGKLIGRLADVGLAERGFGPVATSGARRARRAA